MIKPMELLKRGRNTEPNFKERDVKEESMHLTMEKTLITYQRLKWY